MPIYVYECPQCESQQEHIMGVNDQQPVIHCDHCEAAMARILGAPAPHQMGGEAGKKRTHELVRKRNADYRKTGRYKDERVAGIESARRRGLPA